MKAIVIGSTKHLLFFAIYGFIASLLLFIAAVVWFLTARSELEIWHTTRLKNEYHQLSGLTDFSQYLALEDKLFNELDRKIYQQYTPKLASPINRYEANSLSDPNHWDVNWNRSFEWSNPDANYGILFLHGMSDSPYAISNLARHFSASADVLGLRLPGHGTIPAGLADITWPDLASAVALATQHMKQKLAGKPLYVVGFSTGAALALNLQLEAIAVNNPTDYQAMMFLSPAIGLAPIAAGAKWQARLGRLINQEKLFWNTIEVEYDPFKYISFAVNAGDVVYQLAERNQYLIKQFDQQQLANIPPILTFQSIADDTVSTNAVVEHLYQYLPSDKHSLVIFDINRNRNNHQLITKNLLNEMGPLWLNMPMNYRLSLIENSQQSEYGVQEQNLVESEEGATVDLALKWPAGVYSLSHVALPFPENDPLYGPHYQPQSQHIQIGQAIFKGERGLFGIPAAEMLRQKWNPFYPYMLDRLEQFIEP
ncbi:alpha/beta hydrolase [Shewanella sp. 10N.286.48.B5]|uniref:alpha/beta hydrolase n=1 Tax=Shewanella sp. 10N.286.48.B5 TaxID=1880834 RepID=UPI000C81A538|nr:alpha/beta fold hydrolase [Shewanella sp. 10N.286.48.B5]PMH89213.1 thioesterase [Shewanella sp. 10N.286.48.B5]